MTTESPSAIDQMRCRTTVRGARPAFSLVELLTVVGLVALLLSLLLPVIGKVRAAAQSTACLSNLRQMTTAWVLYTTESRGYLMHDAWVTRGQGDSAWERYWPGVLDAAQVRGPALLCPGAREPSENEALRGYGNVTHAWTGKFDPIGTVFRLNDATYRDSSYGFNRFLTAGGGLGGGESVSRITTACSLTDLPVFFDCAAPDVRPINGSGLSPVNPPPNLRGDRIGLDAPDHWRLLLARHGRGINVAMADGSARWTRLEDLYMLGWRTGWNKYRLQLPVR